jgi:hypothetical protein
MEVFTNDKSYWGWRDAVDARFHQIYCITIVDAGIDEKYLIDRWQSNETPFEFVEWFGIKYDLDPVTSFVRSQEQRGQH